MRTVKQLHELKALTAEKLALEAQIEGEPTPTADLGRLFARHHHVCLRIRELRDKLPLRRRGRLRKGRTERLLDGVRVPNGHAVIRPFRFGLTVIERRFADRGCATGCAFSAACATPPACRS